MSIVLYCIVLYWLLTFGADSRCWNQTLQHTRSIIFLIFFMLDLYSIDIYERQNVMCLVQFSSAAFWHLTAIDDVTQCLSVSSFRHNFFKIDNTMEIHFIVCHLLNSLSLKHQTFFCYLCRYLPANFSTQIYQTVVKCRNDKNKINWCNYFYDLLITDTCY